MKIYSLFKLAAIAMLLTDSPAARASLSEPDNIIYGQIIISNDPVTASRVDIVIEARRTPSGAPVASYQMGSDPKIGNFFSLHIPLESLTPLNSTSTTVVGDALYIVVRDATGTLGQKSYVVAARGAATRSDFIIGSPDADQNGLPDAWEQANFGGSVDPNADPDGDGLTNLQEFIQNTDPKVKDGFLLRVQAVGGQTQVTFNAPAATGPGYENLARYYAIESTTNVTGTWTGLPGYTNILAANQSVVYLNSGTNNPTFYRGKVWLVTP